MERKFNKVFYDSKEWKQARELVLMRDKYLCRYCGSAAQDVHHIIHLTPSNINDPRIALSEKNLISLCGTCHKRLHQNEKNKLKDVLPEVFFDEEGRPIVEQ